MFANVVAAQGIDRRRAAELDRTNETLRRRAERGAGQPLRPAVPSPGLALRRVQPPHHARAGRPAAAR